MLDRLDKHIKEELSFLDGKKLLVAISGGIDSVVLMHACHELGLNIALAHCNFNLRGEESDTDEAFLIDLADELNLEIFIERFDTEVYAETSKQSIQMAARALRYQWFDELVTLLKFDYVLVAHHADDNLETFLINLIRGTGLDGLTGIPQVNNYIVRPLLPFSRAEIQNYAKANNLQWREDSSNSSTKYLRNKLRHDVIPELKQINAGLLKNFSTTQQHLNHSKTLVDDYMAHISKAVISKKEDTVVVNIPKLLNYPNTKACLYELLKQYNFTAWEDIYNLLQAQSGKQVFSETHQILKDRDVLIVKSNTLNPENSETDFIIPVESKVFNAPFGIVSFKTVESLEDTDSDKIFVDQDKLKFPLALRIWEQGDVFYPFGMRGKKKLSKYLKDEKVSVYDKEDVWVLTSDNDIVWVIGRRSDNRFKVTTETKSILEISIE
ncbi:tRNA lysidine(34) synthetase TilS [Formosa sp. S-31]|uniref:tRNA lysidine(34) synthetase TilS n=1 Tax=Formosa sp. S-31 TaxID=2790949 RepID=UPI003EBFCB26